MKCELHFQVNCLVTNKSSLYRVFSSAFSNVLVSCLRLAGNAIDGNTLHHFEAI